MALLKQISKYKINFNQDCPNLERFTFGFLNTIKDLPKNYQNIKELENEFYKQINITNKTLISQNELSPDTLKALMEKCSNAMTKHFILYLMVQRELDQINLTDPYSEINKIIKNIICNAPKLAKHILVKNKEKIRALLVGIQDTPYDANFNETIRSLYINLLIKSQGYAPFISHIFNLLIALDSENNTNGAIFFKIWKYNKNKINKEDDKKKDELFLKFEFENNKAPNKVEYGFIPSGYKIVENDFVLIIPIEGVENIPIVKYTYTADISCISKHVNIMIQKKIDQHS